jgi:hypothetical protein
MQYKGQNPQKNITCNIRTRTIECKKENREKLKSRPQGDAELKSLQVWWSYKKSLLRECRVSPEAQKSFLRECRAKYHRNRRWRSFKVVPKGMQSLNATASPRPTPLPWSRRSSSCARALVCLSSLPRPCPSLCRAPPCPSPAVSMAPCNTLNLGV